MHKQAMQHQQEELERKIKLAERRQKLEEEARLAAEEKKRREEEDMDSSDSGTDGEQRDITGLTPRQAAEVKEKTRDLRERIQSRAGIKKAER